MKSRRATWLGLAMSLTTTWEVGSHVDGWTDFRHGVPDGRDTHTAVWTGSKMIVWGGV